MAELVVIFTQWQAWSPAGSTGPITIKRVRQWYDNRHRTGFPRPVARRQEGRRVLVWDILTALIWFTQYEAKRGKPRKGSKNPPE